VAHVSLKPKVLQRVHELPQSGRRDVLGALRPAARRIPDQPAHVAEIAHDRMRAVPRLERQVVPELLEPERERRIRGYFATTARASVKVPVTAMSADEFPTSTW
jgi:hypothetical protein